MTVYGYTRVSTAEQAADDRTSLETQRRKIAAAAELSGLTVDALIEEPGVSGAKPLAARPEGGPLLAQLQKRRRADRGQTRPGLSQRRRCTRHRGAAEGAQGRP